MVLTLYYKSVCYCELCDFITQPIHIFSTLSLIYRMYTASCDSSRRKNVELGFPVDDDGELGLSSYEHNGFEVLKKRWRPSESVEGDLAMKKHRGHPVHQEDTDHWPVWVEKKGRCKYPGCKGIVKSQCSKCVTYLCFTAKKNCFKNFHKQRVNITNVSKNCHNSQMINN